MVTKTTATAEEQKGPIHICESRRTLGERFAAAARLYAEAVVAFTSPLTLSQNEYNQLRETTEKARKHAEAIKAAYEEHIAWHRCQEESFLSRTGPSEVNPQITPRNQGAGEFRKHSRTQSGNP